MTLSLLDVIVFGAYFLGVIVFALTVAYRQKNRTAEGFFLAERNLPWYAVGASIIAAGVSAEHFIGTVGWSYLYGMAVANWQWAAVFVYSVLIWVFLPFYMRGNVATMPEFLEIRYNKACRYIYACVSIIGMVIALLGGVLFAGAKALNVLFPELSVLACIFILAAAAGTYTIYGGLISGAWADLLQYCILMVGGALVAFYGLHYVGGVGTLFEALPEKAIMLYPADHEAIPWTGLIATFLSVGIWYNCANQFIVQRCLGARSEWDARMGVVMAGFTMAAMPLVVVLPGIIAFHLFSDQLSDGDQSWPFLVKTFLPTGITGLVLAGLAAAIMSTLSAIVHASATILSLDLYRPILRPQAGDRELRLVGRLTGGACLALGVIIAIILASVRGVTVFGIIQTVFFYVASPVAAIFLVGIFWRRATPAAAFITLLAGFAMIPVVRFAIFPLTPLAPYDSFMHHTFAVLIFSVVLLIVLSRFTKPKSREELRGVIWDASALRIPDDERRRNRGVRNLAFWWGIMVAVILALYVITNSRSGRTEWLEATELESHTEPAGAARIQHRRELPQFNLWTDASQVLFSARNEGDTIAFELPIAKSGDYRLGAVVTAGPGYGEFEAEVDGEQATISSWERIDGPGGRRPALQRHETTRFSGAREAVEVRGSEEVSGFTVERIELGTFSFSGGTALVRLRAVNVPESGSVVGVDSWILTRVDKDTEEE